MMLQVWLAGAAVTAMVLSVPASRDDSLGIREKGRILFIASMAWFVVIPIAIIATLEDWPPR